MTTKEETKEKEREIVEEKKVIREKMSLSQFLSPSLCSIIADDSDPWTGFPLTSAVSQKKKWRMAKREEKMK